MNRYSRTSTLLIGGLIIALGALMAMNIPGLSTVLSYWPVGLVAFGLYLVAQGKSMALGLITAVIGLQVLSLRLDWPAGASGNTFRGVLFVLIGILVLVMFADPKKTDGPSE